MFRKLFGSGDGPSAGPFYRPYKNAGINQLYNLLFCDDPALFRNQSGNPGPLGVVLSDAPAREALERIGNDLDAESRVRALAFNRLRAMNVSVPRQRLLGTIIEFPQDGGLDVLAIFSDGRLRYINQSESPVIFETTPPALAGKADEVLRASQLIVNQIGPWDKPRRPPPKGDLVRITFLVSDGLYFGEAAYSAMMEDPLAAAVMTSGGELLHLLVETALEMQQDRKG
jgi:hypothetical protein